MPVLGFLSTVMKRLLKFLATELLLIVPLLFIQSYNTPNGGNVMHNNAAVILVIAPPDAGFQGVGGIARKVTHPGVAIVPLITATSTSTRIFGRPLEAMSSVLKYKKRFKRFGHKGAITSLAFDTSGSILAAGSLDGHISVWAAATGSSLHRVHIKTVYFHAHSGPICCISPCSNDKLWISGAVNEVAIWKRDRNCVTGEETWEVLKTMPQPPEQHPQVERVVKVTSVNWLRNRNSSDSEGGQKLVVTSYLWHGVMCWDLATSAIMWRLGIPDCLSLALAPDGLSLAAYGVSNSFEVYGTDSEKHHLLQTLPWEERPDLSPPPVTFAHDGFAIISGGSGKASIWDVEKGDELQRIDCGGTGNVTAVTAYSSASADRFLIVTGTDEGESSCIILWDAIPHGNDGSKVALLSWMWIAPT
ncbi:WD40-repeat-containing domain protein [Lactarius tabidus]